MLAAERPFLQDTVDLERYPITEPGSEAYRAVVDRARSGLSSTGCSLIEGFLRPDAVERLREEGRALIPFAHDNNLKTNPYSTKDDPRLPPDHPARTFMERTNAFVARECIPEDSALQRLYTSASFKRFVAACVEEPVVHEYADPLAGLVVNVLKPGCQHPWHYDTNEFIVSTLLQHSEQGGAFEYCPQIRNPHSENYERVKRVLRDEDRSEVQTLHLRAGDLQLFKGRFSLHRVTRIRGQRPRLTAIFAYAKEPGFIGKAERARQIFGRCRPEHLEADEGRNDGLRD